MHIQVGVTAVTGELGRGNKSGGSIAKISATGGGGGVGNIAASLTKLQSEAQDTKVLAQNKKKGHTTKQSYTYCMCMGNGTRTT